MPELHDRIGPLVKKIYQTRGKFVCETHFCRHSRVLQGVRRKLGVSPLVYSDLVLAPLLHSSYLAQSWFGSVKSLQVIL